VRTAYAYRHGRVELQLVVRLGLDSHHWLLVTEPTLEVRAVGGWHLLVQRYHLDGERHGRSCNRVASLATLQLLNCVLSVIWFLGNGIRASGVWAMIFCLK
jgi:hypothetical protein